MRERIFAALLTFGALIASASAGGSFDNVKSVAVISAIGDCIRLQRIDATIFSAGEDAECAPIDGIDETVVDQITKALLPHFAVKAVRYNRDAIAHMPFVLATGMGEANIDAQLKAIPNPGVDAYVVVQKLRLSNVISDNSRWSDGLGMARESSLFGATNKMFALFTIRVIDARTFKELADHPVKKPGSFLGLFPIMDVDEALWARWAREVTAEKKAAIKAKLMPLIQEGIADSLHKMQLTP
jgi:hypothetical protein